MNSGKIVQLMKTLSKLPAINQRSVKKLCFGLFRNRDLLKELIVQLIECRDHVHECVKCGMYTEADEQICFICSNSKRNKRYLCIVSDMMNLLAIERTNMFDGVYYVLHNLLSNVNSIGPEDLDVGRLEKYIEENEVEEVLIGLSPNLEGQATSHYLQAVLKDIVKVKTLSIGISLGSDLEYVDSRTIAYALPANR